MPALRPALGNQSVTKTGAGRVPGPRMVMTLSRFLLMRHFGAQQARTLLCRRLYGQVLQKSRTLDRLNPRALIELHHDIDSSAAAPARSGPHAGPRAGRMGWTRRPVGLR